MPSNDGTDNISVEWCNSTDNIHNNNDNNINKVLRTFVQTTTISLENSPNNSSRYNSPSSIPSSPSSLTLPTFPLQLNPSNNHEISNVATNIKPSSKAFISKKKQFVNQTNTINKIILWWPLFVLHLIKTVFYGFISILATPLKLATPTFWLSVCLYLFWTIIQLLTTLIQWVFVPKLLNNYSKQHTVLISGGSTIQTLHLARNFYATGARVIVFDFDGLFSLARFSIVVSKYYTISKLNINSPNDYIVAIYSIFDKERPAFYIPVCVTSAQEVSISDDMLEIIKNCMYNSIEIAPYRIVTSTEELLQLYDLGWISDNRNFIIACGKNGIIERYKFLLSRNKRDVRLNYEISNEKRWVIIRDLPGEHFITCTTIKESKILTNVICSIQQRTKSLLPVNNSLIDKWIYNFFDNILLNCPINGHITFRFVQCEQTGNLYLLGSRIVPGLTAPVH